jgi:hypothetical protein
MLRAGRNSLGTGSDLWVNMIGEMIYRVDYKITIMHSEYL